MARLEVRSLSRYFPGTVVGVEEATFTVDDGRIAALLGPAGSGKTTTLRLIAGLDQPDAGDVLLDDRSLIRVPAHRRGVGLLFQELALFPHMNVRDNVAFGLRMKRWPKAERVQRVADLLELVGLTDQARHEIHGLSTGDRQRVAFARAIAPQPAVVLLDEPLGATEETRKHLLRSELRGLLRAVATTAVIVSRDLRDAIVMADDLVVMDAGRVLQSGPLPRVLAGPNSVRVALMLGYVVLTEGSVSEGSVVEEDVGAVRIPDGFPLEHGAVVLAHPSTLLGVPDGLNLGCGVSGTILRVRPDGPMHLLDVALGAREVEVRWEWDLRAPTVGSRVEIAARPGTLRFFNAPAPIIALRGAVADVADEPSEVDGTDAEPVDVEPAAADDSAPDVELAAPLDERVTAPPVVAARPRHPKMPVIE